MAKHREPISFGRKLELERFRPSGFDYLRIFLAVAVVASHSSTIAEGEAAGARMFSSTYAEPLKFILPAFFSLSGFLVAGSMERSKTLLTFIGLRVIRIYPALMVEVILSALLIGPFVTIVPLGSYFTSPTFFRYLVNVTGHISFRLPGVFVHNPKPDIVNWQLWTVPFELLCYASIALLILAGLKKRRFLVLFGMAGLLAIYFAHDLFRGGQQYRLMTSHVDGRDLVLYFLAGVAAFLYRDRIPWDWRLAVIATAAGAATVALVPDGQYVALVPLVYLTMFLGLCAPRRLLFIGLADFSYGVYLYGYVIQQLVADVLPATRTWYWNMAVALPLSVVAGMVSWYAVERPALKLRGHLKAIEARWIAIRAGLRLPWGRGAGLDGGGGAAPR